MKKILTIVSVFGLLLSNNVNADIISPSFGDSGFLLDRIIRLLPILIIVIVVFVISFIIVFIMRKIKKLINKRKGIIE